MDYFGSGGLFCTPKREGTDAIFEIEARITNAKENCTVKITVADKDGRTVKKAELPAKEIAKCELEVENAHLWQGVEDAYLYTITAELCENGKTLDKIEERVGVREFEVDPQKGFILNGKATPLRGVARHQDREGMGYAITAKEHCEDAELIREVGANTVRLAHYQHDSFFYDLCDELGFVVWAEIPLISAMSGKDAAHENCKSQLRELVYQNYNHPSICFWGIANEITIRGESEKMYENLEDLNNLAHDLDKSRLTTMAQFTAYPKDGRLNFLTDVLSYNHYFGWYMGKFEDNEKWLDEFHEQNPERAIGLSEYGCEGITRYHSDKPRRKDYSEEYQALYHEHMAKVISERNWLWATHVWNMFDFAADSRDEGGVKGRNNKGLVTMDRKIKKDAFYLYKAYWSSDAFVHICGKRYEKRTGDFADIKIYSNQNAVKLFKDGELVGEKSGEKVFEFCNIPIEKGKHVFLASVGDVTDSAELEFVTEKVCYSFDGGEGDAVANWFEDAEEICEMTYDPAFYSVRDNMGEILQNEKAAEAFLGAVSAMMDMKIDAAMLASFAKGRPEEMKEMLLTFGGTEKQYKILNAKLQQIKK